MFEIRITSLHEFRLFVKIIKGQDLSEEDIKKITKIVDENTDKLEEAVKSQTENK